MREWWDGWIGVANYQRPPGHEAEEDPQWERVPRRRWYNYLMDGLLWRKGTRHKYEMEPEGQVICLFLTSLWLPEKKLESAVSRVVLFQSFKVGSLSTHGSTSCILPLTQHQFLHSFLSKFCAEITFFFRKFNSSGPFGQINGHTNASIFLSFFVGPFYTVSVTSNTIKNLLFPSNTVICANQFRYCIF